MSEELKSVGNRKNKCAIMIAAGVLLAIIAVVIIVLLANSRSSREARLFKSAEKYFSEMQYEQAIAKYESVIELNPKNVEAYLGLANCYVELDMVDDALEVLQTGIDETDSDKLIDRYEEICEEYGIDNPYDKASDPGEGNAEGSVGSSSDGNSDGDNSDKDDADSYDESEYSQEEIDLWIEEVDKYGRFFGGESAYGTWLPGNIDDEYHRMIDELNAIVGDMNVIKDRYYVVAMRLREMYAVLKDYENYVTVCDKEKEYRRIHNDEEIEFYNYSKTEVKDDGSTYTYTFDKYGRNVLFEYINTNTSQKIEYVYDGIYLIERHIVTKGIDEEIDYYEYDEKGYLVKRTTYSGEKMLGLAEYVYGEYEVLEYYTGYRDGAASLWRVFRSSYDEMGWILENHQVIDKS